MALAVLRHVDRGDTIVSTVTFTDDTDAPANPTTVTFYVISPRGQSSETAYVYGTDDEVANPETGTFTLTLPMTMQGDWLIRCLGEGAISQVARGKVTVDRDVFS